MRTIATCREMGDRALAHRALGPRASRPLLKQGKEAGGTKVGLARLWHFKMSKSTTVDFDPAVPALSPPKQPLDIGELQLHIGRAAMIALAGIRRRFHFAQQRVHRR